MPDEENALRDLPNRVAAAENNADPETLAALWTEDGMLMDPGFPLVQGAEAIRSFWQDFFQHTRLDVSPVAEEVQIAGPWAFIRISARVTATNKTDGTSQDVTGKGIWIAKKQTDGSWKLARTIFNTDA